MSQSEVPLRFHHVSKLKRAMVWGADEEALQSLRILKIPLTHDSDMRKHEEFEETYVDFLARRPLDNVEFVTPENEYEVAWVAKLQAVMLKYLSLPNDGHVRLISGGRDWICNCALVGYHCAIQDAGVVRRELEIANRLESKKVELDVQGPYIRVEDKHSGLFVLTTMGVLRNIIEPIPHLSSLFFEFA